MHCKRCRSALTLDIGKVNLTAVPEPSTPATLGSAIVIVGAGV